MKLVNFFYFVFNKKIQWIKVTLGLTEPYYATAQMFHNDRYFDVDLTWLSNAAVTKSMIVHHLKGHMS